jgi:hypothetical protein
LGPSPLVDVASDGSDRRNAGKLGQDLRVADIASVNDEVAALEEVERLGPEKAVRIGNQTDDMLVGHSGSCQSDTKQSKISDHLNGQGYDSEANRVAARAGGKAPVIPRRGNSKRRGRYSPKRLYKLRARVEHTIGTLKRLKRVAMRGERTDISYSAIVSVACGLMLAKSVHTA